MTVEQKNVRHAAVSRRTLFYLSFVLLSSFLIGRVSVAGEMHPFGTALLIACFSHEKAIDPFIAMAGVYASLCTAIGELTFPEYNFCALSIICVCFIILRIIHIRPRRAAVAVIVAAACFISAAIFKSTVLLSFAYTAGEVVICLLCALIFSVVIKLISQAKMRRILSEIELLSVSFFAVICLAGIGEAGVAGIRIIGIAAAFICICAAYCAGAARGALVGAFCALACMTAGVETQACVIPVICAAVSGLFKKLIKPVFAGVYTAGALICIAALGAEITVLAEVGIAAGLFCIIPQRAYDRLRALMDGAANRKNTLALTQKRFNELSQGRIKDMSRVLKSAARTFKGSAEARRRSGMQYAVANIPERCCVKCENYELCWDKQFDGTYAFMQQMYNRYRVAGKIVEKDMTRDYITRCIKPKKLIFTLNSVFNEYSLGARWEDKVMESRSAIAEQLAGLSNALEKLEEDVSKEMEVDENAENELAVALDKMGRDVRDVTVTNTGKDVRVELRIKNCGGRGACMSCVKKTVSEVCGCEMSMENKPVCGTGLCALKYTRARSIALKTAVARATKEGSVVSGDTYSLKPLPDGRYMLLICDGMGSGERAQRESFAAANLIEDYYCAGFDEKSVLNMVNKLMLLSSSDEVFSALDMCIVNLRDANAKFTKIGAPHSYVISGDKVHKLCAGALPLGILEECEPQEHNVKLEEGDLVILFSDGVAEAELNDNALYERITRSVKADNVKSIADRIIRETILSSGGAAKDDLTVIVSRVTAA